MGGLDRLAGVVRALADEATEGSRWENDSLPRYLDALAAWLADADGYYVNNGRVPPSNSWDIMEDAVRAAAVYK